MNPLDEWQSEEVKHLLRDYLFLNFNVSGNGELVDGLVNYAWENRNKIDHGIIADYINDKINGLKTSLHKDQRESNQIDLVDFSDSYSILDIGSNTLDFVNKIASKHKAVNEIIALDNIPQRSILKYPKRSRYIQYDATSENLPIPEYSLDLVNIRFVVHHIEDLKRIRQLISNSYRVLKPGGKLVFWEESYLENPDVEQMTNENNKLGIFTDADLTSRFHKLDDVAKLEFLLVNDWWMNVNNPHINWTKNYLSWRSWVNLIESIGYKLKNQNYLGLRISGKLKQGVHVVGEFSKPVAI